MAAKRYRLSPQAEGDLERIWLYTFENWSLAQADRYQDALVAEIEALAAGRRKGQTSAARVGYLKRACSSHVIWYQDRGNWLESVRVLHAAQDPERHLHD